MGSPLAFASLLGQQALAAASPAGEKNTDAPASIDVFVRQGRRRFNDILFHIGNFFINISRIHSNPDRTEKDPVTGKDRVEKDPVPGRDRVEKDPIPKKKSYSPDIEDGTGEKSPNKKIEEPGRYSRRIPFQYQISRTKITKMA